TRLTSSSSHSPQSMRRRSRVAPVLVSVQESEPASAWAPEPAWVLAQVREPAPVSVQEPAPARELVAVPALEPPLAESMAPVALTNRKRRSLPQAARAPQREELT